MSGVNKNKPLSSARRINTMVQAALAGATDSESNDQGASMVEYALLLVLVLLVSFFTVQVFGESLVGLFDASANTLENAPNVNPEG